jgi:hypothetical protein
VRTTLADDHVPALLAAFELGSSGRLSDGPVASGRLGSIWRLDTAAGSWAVKLVGDVPADELAEVFEGAAFQEAARAAGVPTPAVVRTPAGELIADLGDVRVRLHAWIDLHDPDPDLDPVEVGRLVAALHGVEFAGTTGLDPWYSEPIGAARWSERVASLRAHEAPFVGELEALMPELVALEAYLGGRRRHHCHATCGPTTSGERVRGAVRVRLRHRGARRPLAGARGGPRRVRHGGSAARAPSVPRTPRPADRAASRAAGLRDADRAALPIVDAGCRRGWRRRPRATGPTTRPGSRVPRQAVDTRVDRLAARGLSVAAGRP